MSWTEIGLLAVGVYMAIGFLWTASMFASLKGHSQLRDRWHTGPARAARFVLYFVWAADWLPTVVFYWVKAWREREREREP